MPDDVLRDEHGREYFDQTLPDGTVHRRYLTAYPTPEDHPLKASRAFEAVTGINVIKRADFKDYLFETRQTGVPIVDQDGLGKCVCSASKSAVEIARARSGAPFIELSDDFLYTLCNDGRDAGTYAGRAVENLQTKGIAPKSDVQGMPLRPPGVNQVAMKSALRFRLRPGDGGAILINTIEEAFTAVASLWVLLFDVQAGGRYNTNADGVVSYLGRMNNHEQSAGEGLRIGKDGRVQFLGRNSWGTSWGDGGWGWFTEDHMMSADSIVAVKYMIEDPEDTQMPPILRA